ncbi:MAG: sodium:solute symporter [Planctomycetota bacterium]|jgi:SSS family transporter
MPALLAITLPALDWAVLGAYLTIVIGMGILFARRQSGADEFFLAARSMPVWAVAISVLATAQSAATFVGGPQQAYAGDLTYLSANLGGLIAVVIVAVFFLPAFYHHRVTSVYELLGNELGTSAQRAASAMFMVGRVLASGARLFIVAIPFSLIAFETIEPRYLVVSIAVIAAAATAYTLAGGIRAVIWTDVLQAAIYLGTIGVALGLLWQKIPLSPGELLSALKETGDAHKLRIIDAGFDVTEPATWTRPYNLWAVIFGLSLLNLAAFGTDQDLTQRMLTCRSARRGSWSVVVSHLIGWPVVFLFLLVGLLLYVYYQRPDIMGEAAPTYAVGDSRRVFVEFIVREMPAGLRGLMMAGLFAAAMSSLDSALNAMASTTVADFYRPLRARRERDDAAAAQRETRVSRRAVIGWSIVLAAFACFCVYWHGRSDDTLIDFALDVMVFAYSGLLAVFLTALFTRRGNATSAVACLLVGFGSVLALHGPLWDAWTPAAWHGFSLAFGWKMLVATSLSFAVCCLGRRRALFDEDSPRRRVVRKKGTEGLRD